MDGYSTNDRMNKWFAISFIKKLTEVIYKLRNFRIGRWSMNSFMRDTILYHNVIIVPKASYVIRILHGFLCHQTMYLQ